MPDTLNIDLRHTIRLCWKSLRGQQTLKKVVIDRDLAEALPDEFSPTKQITNRLSCGDSANRLCEILVGETLQNYKTAGDAVNTTNEEATREQIVAMKRIVGRVLVRLNILEGGAGHSYVFISKYREIADALEGQIYQTNVGVHMDTAFDLIHWIDDPKSYVTIDLEAHVAELRGELSSLTDPDGVYQRRFMLSTKKLTEEDTKGLRSPKKRAEVVFMWRPIVIAVAQRNLEALRGFSGDEIDQPLPPPKAPVDKVRSWPTVQANPGAFRSTG